jgi:hypothetical protein
VVQQKLIDLMQEIKDGKRESTIISTYTVESLSKEDGETWDGITKELEEIGISIAAFDANKDFILDWFKEAVETGAFQEDLPANDSVIDPFETSCRQFPETNAVFIDLHSDSLFSPKDDRSQGLLKVAVQWRGVDTVKRMLENGADVEEKDDDGMTCLHWAVKSQHRNGLEKVRVLLAHGAKLEAKNSKGETPLRLSILGKIEVMRCLLENGAKVDNRTLAYAKDENIATKQTNETVALLQLYRGKQMQMHADNTPISSKFIIPVSRIWRKT